MKYEVIDNFLDKKYFDSLVSLVINSTSIPWFFQPSVTEGEKRIITDASEDRFFYMTHMFYNENANPPNSILYDKIFPIIKKLKVENLLRVKANLYPCTAILHEHPLHVDYDYSTSGAILSLNTCDGYTKFEDGTKVKSVANRILLFDASNKHCASTVTNINARFNININYIQDKF